MKRLLISIFAFNFFLLSNAQTFDAHNAIELNLRKEHSEKMRVNKVKKKYTYYYKFDTINGVLSKKVLLQHTDYNEMGNPKEELSDVWWGTTRTYYTYNKKKQLESKSISRKKKKAYFDESKRIRDSLDIVYNDSINNIVYRQKIDIDTFNAKESTEIYEYRYNTSGKIVKERIGKFFLYRNDKVRKERVKKTYNYKNIVNKTLDLIEEKKNFEVICSVDNNQGYTSKQSLYDSINRIFVEKEYLKNFYIVLIYYLNDQFKVFKKESVWSRYKTPRNTIGRKGFLERSYSFSSYKTAPVKVIRKEKEKKETSTPFTEPQVTLYKYDENNNLIEISNSNPSFILTGNTTSKVVYKYNKKGLLIEKIQYGVNNTEVSRYRYDYEFYE